MARKSPSRIVRAVAGAMLARDRFELRAMNKLLSVMAPPPRRGKKAQRLRARTPKA